MNVVVITVKKYYSIEIRVAATPFRRPTCIENQNNLLGVFTTNSCTLTIKVVQRLLLIDRVCKIRLKRNSPPVRRTREYTDRAFFLNLSTYYTINIHVGRFTKSSFEMKSATVPRDSFHSVLRDGSKL